jgi:hypothetical protein
MCSWLLKRVTRFTPPGAPPAVPCLDGMLQGTFDSSDRLTSLSLTFDVMLLMRHVQTLRMMESNPLTMMCPNPIGMLLAQPPGAKPRPTAPVRLTGDCRIQTCALSVCSSVGNRDEEMSTHMGPMFVTLFSTWKA